jgi:hypothetical protein
MSYWIKTRAEVPTKALRGASSSTIIRSQMIKVRKEIKKVTQDETGQPFIKACEDAGIPPTRRQFSKWNQKRGLAWAQRKV